MKRIFNYLRPYKKLITIIVVLSLIISVFTLMDAWLMGRLTDAIVYRSKGMPISLGAMDKQKDQPYTVNLLKSASPWTRFEQADLVEEIRNLDVKVVSSQARGASLTVRILISTTQASDLLKRLEELRDQLQHKLGPLQLSLGIEAAPPKPRGWVLFPDYYTIFILPLFLILVYVARGICTYAQSYAVGFIGQRIMKQLRDEVYANVLGLSMSYFERNKTGQSGQLISRITTDMESMNFLFTSGIFELILKSFVLVLGLAWAFFLNWKLAFMFFLVFPLIIWPVNHLSRKTKAVSKKLMNKAAELTGLLEEVLMGIRIVKAFGMEDHEIKRFKEQSQANFKAAMKAISVGRIFSPVIEIMIAFAIAIFLSVTGVLILNNTLSPSDFYTFIFLMAYITNPLRSMSGILPNVSKAMAASDRIFELLDQKSELVEADNPVELPVIHGKVEFENVSFAYNDESMVLRDINLKVDPGKVIALVGPSGAGKTTMVNLIARFYDPVAGMIKIDGHNLRDIKLSSLRSQIGIVPQEAVLFRGTIAENIAYGKVGAPLEEIIAAAEAANAHEFVSQMADGYQTLVGTRGATLSGGQRQRIAIARALLRDPRILILDEATSALDSQSEILVQEALQRLMKNRTCFVIAHRLSTIRTADRIVVLKAGQIAETGTHEELLEQGGLYSLLYHTQFRDQKES